MSYPATLPWTTKPTQCRDDGRGTEVFTDIPFGYAGKLIIADCESSCDLGQSYVDYCRANAEYIVRACNAYPTLLTTQQEDRKLMHELVEAANSAILFLKYEDGDMPAGEVVRRVTQITGTIIRANQRLEENNK